MSEVVIKIENLGKQYRLGEVGTGTMSNDLNRWWQKVRGKEDPYLKIGEVNDRNIKGKGNLVWALKDINFEVMEGEVLGIIGKNGAGKSTLLKILSRVTGPTIGDIKVKGRIASLLEVGTGFHPDLSGRENVFLNGAILGMTKQEIKSKFAEIVEFSGVERYIDTPVKRYSSGMYVRLAFGVAAHLEPEILIVDEVLSVGDAEFQKKCLGKMKDVSGQGRTVLFVSHNIGAIQGLCNKCLLLQNGKQVKIGPTQEIIDLYSNSQKINNTGVNIENRMDRVGNGKVMVTNVILKDHDGNDTSSILIGMPYSIEVYYKGYVKNAYIGIVINGRLIENIIQANSFFSHDSMVELKSGRLSCFFKENILLAGEYNISIHIGEYDTAVDSIHECLNFFVENKDLYQTGRPPVNCGLVHSLHEWSFN